MTQNSVNFTMADVGQVLISQGDGFAPLFSATPSVTSISLANTPVASTDGTNKMYVDTAILPFASNIITNSGTATASSHSFVIGGTTNSGIISFGSGAAVTLGMNSPFLGDFTFFSESTGDTEILLVQNTANAADSSARVETKVAGTSGGDPYSRYTIGTTQSWAVGISNSANQFIISSASNDTATPTTGNPLLTCDFGQNNAIFSVGFLANLSSSPTTFTEVFAQNLDAGATSSARLTATTQLGSGDTYILFDPHFNINPSNRFEIGQTQGDNFLINVRVDTSTSNMTGTNVLTITPAGIPTFTQSQGTFTPVLFFGALGTTGITYDDQKGYYNRIGNCVFFAIDFTLTSKGSSTGQAGIMGLPFSTGPNATANNLNIPVYQNTTLPAGALIVFFEFTNSISHGVIYYSDIGGTPTPLQNTAFSDNSTISFSGHYFIT